MPPRVNMLPSKESFVTVAFTHRGIMARIRSLKPEAMLHRKVGRLSDRAFRLWIAMLTQADDDGRLVADARHLRLVAFGYHERVVVKHVDHAMLEIAKVGLIRLYTHGGVEYADFPSWHDHQAIDRYTPSTLPAHEDSECIPRTLAEHSPSIRVGSEPPTSEKKEGIGTSVARGTVADRPPNGFESWPSEWEPIKRQIEALPLLSKYTKWLDDLDWWKTIDQWFSSCPKSLDLLLVDAVSYITTEQYIPRTKRSLLQKLRNCMHTAGRIAEREAQRAKRPG